MLTVLELAEQDTQLHKASIHEIAGPCPGCHGTDRFRLRQKGEGDQWRFMCRYCWDSSDKGWGDEIDYLRHFRGMTFNQAKSFLDEDTTEQNQPETRRQDKRIDYTSTVWQERTRSAMAEYQALLMSEDDETGLLYAHERGLNTRMILWAQLGYTKQGGIPRLLVPSINAGRYVAIHRRDLRPDVPKGERWKDVPGSTKTELYLADCLRRKLPTILCEAPLDALSIIQECGYESLNVVATGSVSACFSDRWVGLLARMPLVLVAFDADTAGDKWANEWLKCLPNARRLRPLLHDVNEMLTDQWDIQQWVTQALEQDLETVICEEMPLCTTCLDAGIETVALPDDYEDLMYCQRHHPALRRQDDDNAPGSNKVIQAIMHAFGGVTITIDPPGYTLADRVQDLQEQERALAALKQPAPPKPARLVPRDRRNEMSEEAIASRSAEFLRQSLDRARARRVYDAPFPAYELMEVDGIKTLRKVGMWHPSENRLMDERDLIQCA